MSLLRSEMKELGELGDNISVLLMMMWSVALSGLRPCAVLSREALQALVDLQSSRKSIVETETSSNMDSSLDSYHHAIQGSYPLGECTPKRRRKKIASTMDQSIILKLATWLLKRKRSGA